MSKILIVDDNETNTDILERRLQRKGYKAVSRHSGSEAIDALEKEHFDLIIMDLHMPEMSGTETIRKIKSDEKFNSIPIIAFTAAIHEEELLAAKEAGALDVLEKTGDISKLIAILEKTMPKSA